MDACREKTIAHVTSGDLSGLLARIPHFQGENDYRKEIIIVLRQFFFASIPLLASKLFGDVFSVLASLSRAGL
jgi:hypothetical protein